MARMKAQLVKDADGNLVQLDVPMSAAEETARDTEEAAWAAAAPERDREAKIDAELAAMKARERQKAIDALVARGELT